MAAAGSVQQEQEPGLLSVAFSYTHTHTQRERERERERTVLHSTSYRYDHAKYISTQIH